MAGAVAQSWLRSLWDAIDNRKYKNALKIATSLHAKHPDSTYLLSLKALVLERMGRANEALLLALNAKESCPVDDLTLSTLQIVFQRLNRLDVATSCYEYACAKLQNNVDLMMGLFNCYVREYSYVKQQQTAMKLYKLVSEERYILWAVCSIQLQVSCGNGEAKLLSLAEALLKKHIDKHGLHELEALLMYISILEQQEKIDVALNVLDSKLGDLFSIEVDKLRLQGKLLVRAKEYAAASNVFKSILEACPDDWEVFLRYLGCSLDGNISISSEKDGNSNSHQANALSSSFINIRLSDEEYELRVHDVCTFVKKLQQEDSNDVRRGPFLADVELEMCRLLRGNTDDEYLRSSLKVYFKKFGHLSSFVSDVEGYIKFIEPSRRQDFISNLWELCSQISVDDSVKRLSRTISILQIEEHFHSLLVLDAEGCLSRAVYLANLYMENLHLSRDLDPQEVMHGEELLSMLSKILVQMFLRTRHCGYLFEAISVLEFGLSVRRNIWQYKLSLVHLYSYWAAMTSAFDCYKILEIKNIMLESMSHHIVPQLLKSHLWTELSGNLKEYLRFHEDYLKEAADLTLPVYRHCNYTKVLEFVKFKERMENSYHYLNVRIESVILELKQKLLNLEDVEVILANINFGTQPLLWSEDALMSSLSFNEDLETRPWWTPSPVECLFDEATDGERVNLDSHRVQFMLRRNVRRRCLIPRLIQLSLNCVNFLRETQETDESTFLELKQLLETYTATLGVSFDELTKLLDKIVSSEQSFKDFQIDMVEIVSFAVFYNVWCMSAEASESANKEIIISNSFKNVQRIIELSVNDLKQNLLDNTMIDQSLNVVSPGYILSTLFQIITEPVSWYGIFLQACVRSLTPTGKKKKKSGLSGGHGGILSSTIIDAVQRSVSSFRSVVEDIESCMAGYLKNLEDQGLDSLVALVDGKQELDSLSGQKVLMKPGIVLKALKPDPSVVPALGARIGQSVESWNPCSVAKKILSSHRLFMTSLQNSCGSISKALKPLRMSG